MGILNLKCAGLIGLICLQITGVILLATNFSEIESTLESSSDWIKAHSVFTIFVLSCIDIITVAVVLPVPVFNLIINLTSVYLYSVFPGAIIGFSVSFASTIIGSTIGFLIARYLFKDQVDACIGKKPSKVRAVLKAVETEGVKVIILLRIAPVPLSLVNYGLALTKVSLGNFLIGTLGSLPKQLINIYIVATVETLSTGAIENSILNKIILVLGAIFGVIAVILIVIRAKKELNKYILEEYHEMQEV